jgi:OHCU decarboxylase
MTAARGRTEITELNRTPREQFVAALGWIFEDSPWVAERAWRSRPFSGREDLHQAMVREVESASHEEQLALVRAHPDLGARARMSAASASEQTGAGLDRMPPADYESLMALNSRYRERFGFPFLYAVKGSSSRDLIRALEARIEALPEEEFREALRQIYRIAGFRLEGLF